MSRNPQARLPIIGRLALPPLIERELRSGARRPLFYWLRGLLALAAGFQAYELLDRYVIAPPTPGSMAMWPPAPRITGATLLHQMAWLLFLATLLMGLVSADSINRERREGTLGLLLLTDLTPGEIVWGKMLSCGLTSFLVLLGSVPALMFPVLAGGVTGSQAALIGLGLLNTLFVVLAAGLWMSAVFPERRHAVPATLGLVAALAFGPEVLGGAFFGRGAVPLFRLFGLTGWMTAAQAPYLFNPHAALGFVPSILAGCFLGPTIVTLVHLLGVVGWRTARGAPLLFNPMFVGWFALTHALGWVLLRRAAVTLAATWQDQPHKIFRDLEAVEEWPTHEPAPLLLQEHPADPRNAIASARVSWLTDPRPWDADPVRWRVERLRPAEGLVWLAVGLSFFAQFGTLSSVFSAGAGSPDTWGLLSFSGMMMILLSGGLVAWAAARFFQDTRRQQDLELLLTTPLGGRNIVAGQWHVLRRGLTWPLGLVLAVALPAGLALLYDFTHGQGRELYLLLQPFLISVNLALEVVALCWVGMHFGLRARNLITAVTATVGLVQLLPLALAAALMWAWVWLLGRPGSPVLARNQTPPVILALLFFVAKNLGLIVWARLRLRRELRLGRRRT